VIKIRNDEFYSNLDPFFDTILRNPRKIVTSEVFFRRHDYFPFHPSDHLVGGRTEVMQKSFSFAREVTEDPEILKKHPVLAFSGIVFERITAEQVMCLSIISTLYTKYAMIDPIEIMKDTFMIVQTERLGTFCVKQNSADEEYTTLRFFEEKTDIKVIEDYGKEYGKEFPTTNPMQP
jgi:hypothetical protein